MTDRQEDNFGVSDVRQPFDEARLAEWMAAHVGGFAGSLVVQQFRGGQSNPTYRLTTPGQSYVMRRKPPGESLQGAHAVDREFRAIAALHAAGFPVPRAHGLCTDVDVIGSWFYVMDLVEGRSIWDTSFPTVSRDERPRYFNAMIETLAQLHNLDPVAIGLADFGKPGDYIPRQIRRLTRQYHDNEAAGRDPHLDQLTEWLAANVPPGEEVALIHGDFRCDNMIFHATEPRVSAVLDWELSTLGHPLADLAFHTMIYRMPPEIITGLAGLDLAALNIPYEAEYIATYCRLTGRAGVEHYDFYVAFNMFRLAVILHGIKGRHLRGTATSANAPGVAAHVAPLAKLAWEQTRR